MSETNHEGPCVLQSLLYAVTATPLHGVGLSAIIVLHERGRPLDIEQILETR